jgi:signal transduction histidine kinase
VSGPFDRPEPPATWIVLPNAVNLAGLGLVAWATATQIVRTDHGGRQVVAWVLLVAAVLAWSLWVLLRSSASVPGWVSAAPIVALALAGGALTAFAPVALIFTAVAVLASAMRWSFAVAMLVAGTGWLTLLIGVLLAGHPIGVALGGLAAVFAALLVGTTRQIAVERADQRARMEIEIARAEVERTRAEVLTERNHLARDLHDVLAHTLAALSLQLEAFSTVVDAEPATSPAVRGQLERTRELVRAGLDEARGAVQALREDPAPLEDQLAKLCAQQSAVLTVTGVPRSLPAQVTTNVYRVAQEALTNVMKHASGARASVALAFATDAVSISIDNPLTESSPSLGETGGGFGLRGIAERLELLGGQMEAGPFGDGWRVAATVPVADVPVSANHESPR